MIYLFFYSIILFVVIVALISVFVFVKNTLRELKGEEVLKTDFLQSLRPATKSLDQPKAKVSLQSEVPELPKEPEHPKSPDWSKIMEKIPVRGKISAMKLKEAEEVERFTINYFEQYGASKITFPKECFACGSKTIPQVLRWKAVHKIPALRGAKTPVRTDTNSLWTIVGKCLACDEKYILATQSTDGVVGDLEWVALQRDNYERLVSFNGKNILKEKLSFILRTLPDRSLIARGLTGEWVWLKNEYRSYV